MLSLFVAMAITTVLVKPQSHQAYDQVTTYLRPKDGPIVEKRTTGRRGRTNGRRGRG